MNKAATWNQINFLTKLVSERRGNEEAEKARTWAEGATMKAVSDQIGKLLAEKPQKEGGGSRRGYSPQERVGEGFYSLDGDVYRVSAGVYNDGRPYAKVLDRDSGTWVRAQGAMSRLRSEHALTREAAAEWGRLTGRCARCGRELEDALSVERGVGPVCWTRF